MPHVIASEQPAKPLELQLYVSMIDELPQRAGCATMARVQNHWNAGADVKQSLDRETPPKKIE